MTTRWRWSPRGNWAPAASATLRAMSAVIGSRLAVPRMPSVPKSLRVMGGDYTGMRGGEKGFLGPPAPRRWPHRPRLARRQALMPLTFRAPIRGDRAHRDRYATVNRDTTPALFSLRTLRREQVNRRAQDHGHFAGLVLQRQHAILEVQPVFVLEIEHLAGDEARRAALDRAHGGADGAVGRFGLERLMPCEVAPVNAGQLGAEQA